MTEQLGCGGDSSVAGTKAAPIANAFLDRYLERPPSSAQRKENRAFRARAVKVAPS